MGTFVVFGWITLGWVLFAGAVSFVFVIIGSRSMEALEEFKNAIRKCVVENMCPVGESVIHWAREKVIWFLIGRFGIVGAFMGLWFSLSIVVVFLPYFQIRGWYYRNESLARQFYPL